MNNKSFLKFKYLHFVKWIVLCFLITLSSVVNAQKANDYFLLQGSQRTLNPGGKLDLSVYYIDSSGTPEKAVGSDIISWMVNGHSNDVSSDGKLVPDLTLTHATYTAPEIAPAQNPVAITVKIKPTTGKAEVILYCNVTIRKASYKITMDAEQTIADAGQDIKLHGECFADLKTLPDGTYMLEPVDKTRNMQVTVEKGVYANKDGGSDELIEPYSYTFPFLFSIGKMDKSNSSGHGTVYLNYTSPQKGKVVWRIVAGDKTVIETVDIDQGTLTNSPGSTTPIGKPGNDAANAIALSAVTNLNVLNYFMAKDNGQVAIQNAQQNITNAQSQMDFAKRMEAHENDPAYFRTKQGQADLQKMMSLQQQIGGNIANISEHTKQIGADINNKLMTDNGYAGSKQMNHDLGKEQLSELGDESVTGNSAMAQVAPGFAALRIEGNFNPKSSPAFNETKEVTIENVHAYIKIKVDKISN